MSAEAAGAVDGASWSRAWAAALDALELDVTAAEAVLASDHLEAVPLTRWTPPQGLGPLPRDLVDRAQALLDRQIEVARQLGEAARLSRTHSRVAQAMRGTGPAVPVYVDVAG